MENKSSIKKSLIAFMVIVLLPLASIAVPDPGGDPDDPPAPIDGGVLLLAAAGASYGSKKLYDLKKKSDKE